MSTMVKDPRTSTGSSGAASGALSGAAQGAAAGAKIGGVYGAVIGGVIGAVVGGIGGKKEDKAKKYRDQAYKYSQIRQERQAGIARRDIMRQFRVARASSMVMIGNEEGGRRSSAPQGSIASLGAQFGFNLNFFDADAYLNQRIQENVYKSGKYAAQANMINATLSTVASSIGSMKGAFGTTPPPTTGGGTTSGGTVSQTPLGSNTYAGGNWGTFAPVQPFGK